MNADAAPDSALPVQAPAAAPQATARRQAAGACGVLVALAVIAALAALGGSALLWQRLDRAQEQLVQQAAQSAALAQQAQVQAAAAQEAARANASQLGGVQAQLADMPVLRMQMERLLNEAEAARPREDNLAADLALALRLAQQHAELSGNVQPLLATLTIAKARVEHAARPGLAAVQEALARDLQRLASTHTPDTAAVLARLHVLQNMVDAMPLRGDIVPLSASGPAAAQEPQPAPASVAPAAAQDVPPSTNGASEENTGATTPARWTQWQWWHQGWHAVWNDWGQRLWGAAHAQVRDLVRVRRIDPPDAMLLAPEQAYFLRENLKLRLQAARLALLARQWQAARAELLAASAAATAPYFDASHRTTQTVQAQLQQSLDNLQAPEPPDIQDSLNALAAANL